MKVIVYARFDTLRISQPFFKKKLREAPLLSFRKMSWEEDRSMLWDSENTKSPSRNF